MKIDSSNISMISNYSLESASKKSSRVSYNYSENNPTQNIVKSIDVSTQKVEIKTQTSVLFDYEEGLTQRERVAKQILERLLGTFYEKGVKVLPPKRCECKSEPLDHHNPYQATTQGHRILEGIAIESSYEYYQKQTIDFSSSVELKTNKGSFSIDLDISFTKEMYEAHSSRLVIGKEKSIDPLVINYDGNSNPFDNMSSLKFEFDLDSDGTNELIPLLKRGAGFLALDKNENGEIDNGSELFGTKSGDGFADLAKYDSDGNDFIDESDEVFNRLKVWTKDDSGDAKLVSLIDLNVGAIYLGDVQSGFKYQDSIDSTSAVQKSNGIFIKEDGSGAGVVNSVDMVV
jgi:hypothetical protein